MRKYYATLNDCCDDFTSKNSLTAAFIDYHMFDGTLTVTINDQEFQLPKLIFGSSQQNAQNLVNYWQTYWGEQRIGFPLKNICPYSSEEEKLEAIRTISVVKVKPAIEKFLIETYQKYLRLMTTLVLKYDPIENYSMVEEKTLTNGEETFSHEPNSGYSQLNIVAPHTGVGANIDIEANKVVGLNIPVDNPFPKDNDNVKKVTKNETVTNDDSQNPTVEHYTTTYDDNSTGRLASYDVRKGSSKIKTTTEDGGNVESEHLTPSASYINGKSEAYTDTKSREDDSYTLTRKGNIGVTTSQQMIESEREIARINIIREFFEELNHYIMLQIWN